MQACRWALIGNAVTVPVAKWLGERLMDPCSRKYYVGQKDCKLEAEAALFASLPFHAGQGIAGWAFISGAMCCTMRLKFFQSTCKAYAEVL